MIVAVVAVALAVTAVASAVVVVAVGELAHLAPSSPQSPIIITIAIMLLCPLSSSCHVHCPFSHFELQVAHRVSSVVMDPSMCQLISSLSRPAVAGCRSAVAGCGPAVAGSTAAVAAGHRAAAQTTSSLQGRYQQGASEHSCLPFQSGQARPALLV